VDRHLDCQRDHDHVALLSGLESARLHYVMVAGLAAIIGTNLFLVVELNYPFAGDISVEPTSYRTVVKELGPMRA
jgi:hypothetical protein